MSFDLVTLFLGIIGRYFFLIFDQVRARPTDKIKSAHGVTINKLTELRLKVPQAVFVLPKRNAKQIEKLARSYGVRNIVTFHGMFSQLR